MKILNPLYDWAFKYLMDNNAVAKNFLSIVLKKEVIHLENRNIEVPLLKDGVPFLTRFDFKAVIQTEPDKLETVLIEIQKYKGDNPVERFRKYLGENYMREESFKDDQGNRQTKALPIISVYILGYCPPEFKIPYIIVKNEPYNGITEEKIELESEYVKLLTHSAYFLIATPPDHYQWGNSKQEALIRLFRQKTSVQDDNTIYEIEAEEVPEDLQALTKHLHKGTQEDFIIKQLELEEEYYSDMKKLEELSTIVIQKEIELVKQKKRAEEKERLLEEEKKRAEEKHQKLIETVKLLKSLNVDWAEIAQKTGLSMKEIEEI